MRSLYQQAVDLILHNGKILTADQEFSIKQTIEVMNGKIVTVVSNEQIRNMRDESTFEVDSQELKDAA